ncbi:MAG: nickel pincer cofactor biosynthesis protein LarC [Oscillospiraceae bacterium]
MNTLYFECFSGISGDMTVAALLDLGANQEKLFEIINSMNLGCKLHTSRVEKNGISAFDFDVELIECQTEHRGLKEIYPIIENSQLSANAKLLAKKMFDIVTDAEAKIHNTSREEVHFHEIGAVDSIVDICAVAFCIDDLKIDKVICSPISEGTGSIKCRHGEIPVPVPATAEIARKYGIPVKITNTCGEMITPTGASIVAALADQFKTPEQIVLNKIGIGAGKKNFDHANIIRAYLVSEQPQEGLKANDKIIVIETAIDDSTPEELSFCMKMLLKAGVKDAFYAPIYMKKNRPGWQLTVMCKPETEQEAISIIFKQTTAVGVRRQEIDRLIMDREKIKVQTKHGEVDANIFSWGDFKKTCLEYKSVKHLAKEKGCSIVEIYRNY